MSFQEEQLIAFDETLEVMRDDDNPDSCSFRFPLDADSQETADTTNYDCIPGPSPDMLTLTAGGMMSDYAFTLTARATDFDTLPITGQKISKDGRVSRILSVDNSTVSPILLLHCSTPEK